MRWLAVVLLPAVLHADPLPVARAREGFALARQLADADHGRLWGRPLGGPLLFADPSTRAVVADEPDGEGLLHAEGGAYSGKLPDNVTIANTAVEWAGKRWTMVMWPLPDARYARGRLLAHELFHRLQPDLGIPATNPANAHLDGMDGRIWLQLEWRALSEALVRKGDLRRAAAQDALVFRAERRALAGAGAAEEERALELNEGLAEYTGYRLCGLPEEVLPDRVAARLDGAPTNGLSRGFAYLSGPAYGLLLDGAAPRWRAKLSAASDLGELLRGALGFRLPADLAAEARAHAKRYDGDALIAAENQREEERRARLDGYRKLFVDGPVLRVPFGPAANYSYDPASRP